jgi:hypothetical protein
MSSSTVEDMPQGRGKPKTTTSRRRGSAAATVRERVVAGGERYWKHADFKDLPASAVAMALSRLAREGELQRVGKGVYYRPRPTAFGSSIPAASAVAPQTLRTALHPAGLSAANALGLSTQNPPRGEYATPAAGPPRALQGAVVHTGRPAGRVGLSAEEGAILESLRDRARNSDLSPGKTIARLRALLEAEGRFTRLAQAALQEPPRVRAMLGALGEELGAPPQDLKRLRASLNPLSRFDFGTLRDLRFARDWQAK